MDAHAHLLSLGWVGPGHSLDSRPHLQQKGRRGLAYDPIQNNNTGRGLVKPLLVSQKRNAFGIGKKTHEPAAGNEWWLKGFENALNNIGKNSVSEATSGRATPDIANSAAYRGKHNGLYGFFVKGQQMEGTISEDRRERLRGQKRKSDTFDDHDHDRQASTSSRTSTPSRSLSQKENRSQAKAATDFVQIGQFLDIRDKDRKRGETKAKLHPTHEFEQIGHLFQVESKEKKKHAKKSQDVDVSKELPEADQAIRSALKDEKRRRRKATEVENVSVPPNLSEKEQRRRERKAAKAAATSDSSETKASWSTVIGSTQPAGSPEDSSTPADEAIRKAERKRRKGQKRLAKKDDSFC